MRAPFRILTALVILIGATAPAHAEPISASIAAAIAWIGVGVKTAAIIATAIVTTSVSVGLQYVASAIRGAPKADPFGIKGSVQFGGAVSRTVPFGKLSDFGQLAHPPRTWGKDGKTPNAYYTQVIALDDIPSAGLLAVILEDKRCPYDTGLTPTAWGYPLVEFRVGGKDHAWVKFHDGTQTAVDSWLLSQFAANGSDPDDAEKNPYPITSDMVGYGVPYAIVTTLVNQELFSGFPQPKLEYLGGKFYDPREDSTVGGDGSQRWNDPATWVHTYNPIVVAYNTLRGIAWNGQWLFGLQGTAPARLPLDNWFAAMNACDADRATAAGGVEPAYRCGGKVTVDSEPAAFLEELLKTCNARFAEVGGYMKVRVGMSGAAVMTFTDADLITTEPQTSDPFPGLQETVNGITAKYPEPDEFWALKDAPARLSEDYEEADGDRRLLSPQIYNFCPFAEQVQTLMLSALNEARRFLKHNAVAPPPAWQLEPLDLIARNSDREGYDNKLFDVTPIDQENLDQSLAMVECDPEDYDWSAVSHFVPFTIVPVASQIIAPQGPDTFNVTGVEIAGDDGKSKAGALFTWQPEGNEDVVGVQFEIRRASDDVVVSTESTDNFGRGAFQTDKLLVIDTDYEGRGKFIPGGPRETEWSDWISFHTPDVRITASELAADIASDIALIEGLVADVDTVATAQTASDAALRRVGGVVDDAMLLLAPVQMAIAKARAEGKKALAYFSETITNEMRDGNTLVLKRVSELQLFVDGLVGPGGGFELEGRIVDLEELTADYAAVRVGAEKGTAVDLQLNGPGGLAEEVLILQDDFASLNPEEALATIGETAIAARGAVTGVDNLSLLLPAILTGFANKTKDIKRAQVAFFNRQIEVIADTKGEIVRSVVEMGIRHETATNEVAASVTETRELMAAGDEVSVNLANTALAILSGFDGTGSVQAAMQDITDLQASQNGSAVSRLNAIEASMTGYDGSSAIANAFTITNAAVGTAQDRADDAFDLAGTAFDDAGDAQDAADAAQGDATNALAQLTDIAADNKLVAGEKQAVRQTWNVVDAEKSGLDSQATSFSITTEKTAYDNAFQALATYLNAGTTWSSGVPSWISDANLGATTTITGSTFRSKWQDYFDARTALLNAIAAKAKSLADAAQGTADAANAAAATAQDAADDAQDTADAAASDATSALGQLSDIAADNKLTPVEKQSVRQDWDTVAAEKAGIDSQATAFGITTEKGTYDTAFTALADYLNAGTWSSGVPSWISDANLGTTTTIVGATFRSKWKDYYDARTALLNAIAAVAKSRADAAQSTANTAAGDATTALNTFGSGLDSSHTVSSALALKASASSVTTVSSKVDDVSAVGLFGITSAVTTPGDASVRLALFGRATSGGTERLAGLFIDVLSAGGSRAVLAADQAFISKGTDKAALEDALSFVAGVLTVPAAVISGTLDVDTLIADGGILGPKVDLGEIVHPYRAVLSSAVTTSSTASAETEVLRLTVRSLGGPVLVNGYLTAKRADGGTYASASWAIYQTPVGTGFAFGDKLSGYTPFFMNDGTEINRPILGDNTGNVFIYDDDFDVVLVVKNESNANKRLQITEAEIGVIVTR